MIADIMGKIWRIATRHGYAYPYLINSFIIATIIARYHTTGKFLGHIVAN